MPPTADAAAASFDSEWLDDMVNRLKAELEAQLKRTTEARDKKGTAAARAADARTLAVLERTLEKLARMEQARVLVRETKISRQAARDALECRLDKLAAAGAKKPSA